MIYELSLLCRDVAANMLSDLRDGKIEKIDIELVRERLCGLEEWAGVDFYDREQMEVYTLHRIVEGA